MPLLRRNRKVKRTSSLRLFFATDVHGSDLCFRKFLAAAKVYDAQVLLLGGDVAGKALVPFVPHGGKYEFVLHGTRKTVLAEDYESAADQVRFSGFYPTIVDAADAERLAGDDEFRAQAFLRLIGEQLKQWCQLAEERLDPEIRCIITPGNDDPFELDHVLEVSERIESPERQMVNVGPIRIASIGNVTPTPWDTDREFDESELRDQIDELFSGVGESARDVVFNCHCPPYDSGLDSAPELDEAFRPVVRQGHPVIVPVGSRSVREAIAEYRPGMALHGHIHESQGMTRINDSVCLNPGSEYSAGVLKGVLVDFDENGECVDYLFTTG